MTGRLNRRNAAILSAVVLSLVGRCAPAWASDTLDWDPNPAAGIQGGPGTWNTSNSSWSNAGSPATWVNSHHDVAVFGGVDSGNVQITAAISADALRVDLAGYVIGASGANALTLASGSIMANADVSLGAPLSTPAGLTKTGAGTLTLLGSGTIRGNLVINQGALAFALDGQLGGAGNDIVLAGGRLRYTGNSSRVLGSGHAIVVDAAGGAIETPNAGLTLAGNAQLSGAGILTQLGPQTLLINGSNGGFLGSMDVSGGVLQLQQAGAVNGRPIRLSGGGLALHANQPTDFASRVTVAADAVVEVGQIGPSGVSAQTHSVGDVAIAAGSTLAVVSSNHDSLCVHDLALSGALKLDHSGIFVSGAFSGNGPIAFDLGSQPPELLTTGLIFASGASQTISNAMSAAPGGSGPAAGAAAGTRITYAGAWDGGSDGPGSAVVLRDGGRFNIAAAAHLNTTAADRAGIRPFAVIGDGAGAVFALEPGFVADHTAGGSVADGFSSLEIRDAALLTHNSASLPVISKLDGFGGMHRAGELTFSGTGGARWVVDAADQQYDGGIRIHSSAAFQLDRNLTHTGSIDRKFDGSFQMPNPGTMLSKEGAGTLTLSGEQGYAAGTTMRISAGGLRFETDPGAGWYAGNYTRGVDGNVAAAPTPAGTLSLIVGSGGAASAEFAAAHSRVDSIAIESDGTARMTGAAQTLLAHGLDIEPGGQMLLGGGRLIIDYPAGTAPAAAIAADIASGRIISGLKNNLTVGYGETSDLLHISGNQTGTISGERVDATSLLVEAARIGDANLDGLVNFVDFQRLERGFGLANQGWGGGDFNYDGMVDLADFKLIYDRLDPAGSPERPIFVPEPHYLPIFGVFSAVFCRYGRRTRHIRRIPQNSPESF